jgi:hypothetical protein
VGAEDPNDPQETKPGRIAWISIFASGLVVGLILGLGLSPQGIVGAAREIGQVSALWTSPAAAPTAPTAQAPGAAPGEDAAEPLARDDAAPPPHAETTPPAPPASALSAEAPAFAPLPAGDHPLTVGVFGDSLADGLWAGLYRQMRDGQHVEVVKFSQPATGLTRYDYVDVQAKTKAQLAQRHVDVAVVLFGTNDQQGIVDGGHVYPFGTPGWRQVYGARVDALAALLKAEGAAVYWVGLPKMRAEGFDAKARLIDAVIQQRMAADGVRFIPLDAVTEDRTGAYAAYLPAGADGRMTLMRANDGIHMSMPGYLRIATPVSASIRADLAERGGPAVGGPAISAAAGLR